MAVSCGTVGESSLNPNAPHSVPMLDQQIEDIYLRLREWVQTEFHEYQEQQIAFSRWLHQRQKFSEPPVPKNRMRPLSFQSKYGEKPVRRVRPKCSPHRIIHQPRWYLLFMQSLLLECFLLYMHWDGFCYCCRLLVGLFHRLCLQLHNQENHKM